MPRYSLSQDDVEEETEPPHPVGFGNQWGRTWFSLEPPALPFGRTTYALDVVDDDVDEYDFMLKQGQSFPPLSLYVQAGTAPTVALLSSQEGVGEMASGEGDEDNDVLILRKIVQGAPRSPAPMTSSSESLPDFTKTCRHIEQKIQLERQRLAHEHTQSKRDIQAFVSDLERQVDEILKTRKAEEDALRTKEEQDRREKEAREKQDSERKERQSQEQEQRRKAAEKKKAKEDAEAAQKVEYIAKAKKLVTQLVQVRASIEPFEKNKAVGKRRLTMKKTIRGKINTLSENAAKIREVAVQVSEAITVARKEDEEIKKALERRDPGLTPDMARGKRYLVDLLASNTVQRVQAEGFNGPRGDGFPLASMLAMVSIENKELVPILAAHIYTVCPTAIPTLPAPAPDANEEDLMSSLGMLKDKNGEYESFDRFLSRTENIVALVANVMASSPTNHVLFGGHKGAVDWLSRFLSLLPPAPSAPLPLITAPVLHSFLAGAGHMLANNHTEFFEKALDEISRDITGRLDEGPIGKPSSIRLAKLLEGGFETFKTTLPSRALPELYAGPGGGTSKVVAASGLSGVSNSGAGVVGNSASPFGQGSSPAPFGGPGGSPAVMGGTPGTVSANPFGNSGMSAPNATPFSTASTNAKPATSSSSPFGAAPSGASGFGAFGNTQSSGGMNSNASHAFGNATSSQSPFGGTGGGNMSSNSPFGGPAVESNDTPFGSNMSSFGAPTGNMKPTTSPFGQPTSAATNTPFGSSNATFGSSAATPSPFGRPGSTFGGNTQQQEFGKTSNRNKPPCRFFAKGHCRYGDNCRFSHDTGNNGKNPRSFDGNNSMGGGGKGNNPFGAPRR